MTTLKNIANKYLSLINSGANNPALIINITVFNYDITIMSSHIADDTLTQLLLGKESKQKIQNDLVNEQAINEMALKLSTLPRQQGRKFMRDLKKKEARLKKDKIANQR